MHINELAYQIGIENEMARQAQKFGDFSLDDYTPQEQVALLTMRFNDALAKAIILKLKFSTVAGMDFEGLIKKGLATRAHGERFHSFTPRGKYISLKVMHALAEKFGVKAPRKPPIYTPEDQRRYERGRLNWANR